MLRVLTLSTLFPHAAQPTLGVFVERQTLGLASLDDVGLEVVSALGLPPWPALLHPHYAPRARLPRQEDWKGLTVHRPRFRAMPKVGKAQAARAMAKALLPRLRALRSRFPFDVIAAEFFWPDGAAAMHLSRALGVPFSIKARGADIHYWGARPGIGEQILEAGRAADGLLAVSSALKADMVTLGLPAEPIRVHYTGVDLDRFKPIDRHAAKARLGVEGPLLVTAGALVPRKGQDLVLEALSELDDATLLIVGDGPDRSALHRYARDNGLAGRVRFLGNRPHEELPRLLAAADVMVLASQSEGLANVWVEALACGTPIVISDVGGAREVVDRSEAGRLVGREAGAIAAAVRDLLAAPPAPAAARAAAERFSWDRNARELREHLGALVR
ncbi:glycosyltransferase [Sphingosinicella humi]|uniref:Glycoside hydrolase n=1 Tax=Allosphingosinicella humi TaxID=2068657 RepID=A0A2U2J246_9SPHN|nr:glycosyltransferase [Sphingosinicella humi]PWG02384.1 glycoside hydrolase [Sphingosinicella humi]